MGQFIFDVDEAQEPLLTRSLWPSAYLSGVEGVPWHTFSRLDGCRLTLRRDIDESSKLFLPLPVEGHGISLLSTCSLRPRARPYPLLLELARGSLYNVRNQSDLWARAGLELHDEFQGLLDEATNHFLDASGTPLGWRQADHSLKALELLETASHRLSDEYASQAIAYRKHRETRLATLLAASLPSRCGVPTHADEYAQAFNTVAVRIGWGSIEAQPGHCDFSSPDAAIDWASQQGLRVIAGPLIDFHDAALPDWVLGMEGQFEKLLDSANHYVEQSVKRYKGRVQIWNPASGLNLPSRLRLSEEQVLQLSATLVQSIRRQDPQTPVIFSVDQPLGEYLAHHRDGISPIHFADTIARCGLGLAGLGLEMRIGYEGLGMAPRSSLAIGQTLDRWATLGLPLMLHFAVPGDTAPDPLAVRECQIISADPQDTPQTRQIETATAILRVALAKPFVHAIVWDGWDDNVPHPLPHAGLLDQHGPRPLLRYLQRIRRELLN